MSVSDTSVPISTDTRQQLRVLKGVEDVYTYDDVIRVLIDEHPAEIAAETES